MIRNLSYKKKNRLLSIAGILLLLIVYQLGIRRTMNAYSEYAAAEKNSAAAAGIPQETIKLEKELMRMEEGIRSMGTGGPEHQQELIGLLTAYCQSRDVVLREFPESMVAEQEELLVETNRFVMQGNFHDLLELVYTLEQKSKMGKVASVQYELKKDIISKKNILTATVFLQNIKKKQS